ncbi:MAG: DUF2095 domain-containing protein [Thermococci archaeon]|nr:DUF2095 domain-containing protein [Thermococci archaeon]
MSANEYDDKRGKRRVPMVDFDEDEFREMFPALAEELEEEGLALRVESGEEEPERMDFSGYNPDVIDFLRRCSTDDEALEIINWMEERGEITAEMARELRARLVREGVRAFGSKKEWGWYERHGRP